MSVITVSRLYGCGGAHFAKRLAEELKYAYFDKEIFFKVAEMSKVSISEIKALEGLIGYKINFISKFIDNNFIRRITGVKHKIPDPDELVKYIEEAIIEFAKINKVVIVGRGSQCILKNFPNAYHIKIVATFEDRVKNLMKKGISKEGAESTIKRMDDLRSIYIKKFYNADWLDPSLYHLVINFSRIDEDKAINLVKELIDYKKE